MNRPLRVLAALVLVVTAIFACAKDLDSLEPYPCAADGSCPRGRACIPGVGCTPAQLDAPCRVGATDCTPAAPGATCNLGVCTAPCSDAVTCSAGRVCSVRPGLGAGGCLLDCSEGQSCPKGLACRTLGYDGRMGCVAPTQAGALGAKCAADGDCKTAGAGVRCLSGVCSVPCGKQSDCEEGYVCPPLGGGCLRACDSDTKCSAGMQCNSLWRGGVRACTAPGTELPACKNVEPLFLCKGICGTSLDQQAKACSDGGYCLVGSTCGPGDKCTCTSSTTAKRCSDGSACSDASPCGEGQWWCEPKSATLGCADDPRKYIARCDCADGISRFSRCGSSTSCERRCRDECNMVSQDCVDPATPKCAEVNAPDGTPYSACIATSGAKKAGEPCTRRGTALSDFGFDDCGRGLFCSLVTSSPNTYACRKICNDDCPTGERCIGSLHSVDYRSDMPLCRTSCDPFGTAAECPAGNDCKVVSNTGGYCLPKGVNGILGATCLASIECGPGLSCGIDGYCTAPCDGTAEHVCPAGFTCPARPTSVPRTCERNGAAK